MMLRLRRQSLDPPRHRRRGANWVALALVSLAACSRPAVSRLDSPGSDPSTAPASESRTDAGLPFREPELPAGTQVTVRLTSPITAVEPDAGFAFEATVSEAVVIDGNTVVPQGAAAAGRVESARVPSRKGGHGSLRLVLDSVDIGGKALPIRTSSLFTRGNAPEKSAASAAVTLEKGHRLTFRLAEPVYLAGQQGVPAQ